VTNDAAWLAPPRGSSLQAGLETTIERGELHANFVLANAVVDTGQDYRSSGSISWQSPGKIGTVKAERKGSEQRLGLERVSVPRRENSTREIDLPSRFREFFFGDVSGTPIDDRRNPGLRLGKRKELSV